jgi:DNA-binding IclR family transcriptional regulator
MWKSPAWRLASAYLKAPLGAMTERSITSASKLMIELELVRKNGFATNIEELEMESCAVAAPIFNHRREIVASVLLAVPKYRFSPASRRVLTETIVRYASLMSRRLGG